MFILGFILLILGVVLGISILETIGFVLLILGVVLYLAGGLGHPVGGRNHWF